MPIIESTLVASGPQYQQNRVALLSQIEQLRALEARTCAASEMSKPMFDKRGQLLPRARIAGLLDVGAPFLELSTLAGYLRDTGDADKSIPGGGVIAGIGYVRGARAMVLASDSGINAGALKMAGLDKMLRAQAIALDKKLPFIHLVESAGANLLEYRVEHFIQGGGVFYNLARLSAAGIPVITVVHGSSTAGGAYMPGLSDYVVMVRERSRAFLAGPPLLKAATGEIASEEELGGAEMHASVSGLAEYMAENDADALRIAREIVAAFDRNRTLPTPQRSYQQPRYDAEELLGLMPADPKKPVDMREAIARIVDASEFLEFKPGYGPRASLATRQSAAARRHSHQQRPARSGRRQQGDPLHASLLPIRHAAAILAKHHRLHCRQTIGTSRHDQARLENDTSGIERQRPENHDHVPAPASAPATTACAATATSRDFAFSWPNARTAVMGAEQAADTMAVVMEAGSKTQRPGTRPRSNSRVKTKNRRHLRTTNRRIVYLRPDVGRRRNRPKRHAQSIGVDVGDM